MKTTRTPSEVLAIIDGYLNDLRTRLAVARYRPLRARLWDEIKEWEDARKIAWDEQNRKHRHRMAAPTQDTPQQGEPTP